MLSSDERGSNAERRCVNCGEPKTLGSFYRAEGFALGHMDECKACLGKRTEAMARDARFDRHDAKRLIADAKKRPCTDCGHSFPAPTMEFDHVPGRGQKMFTLSRPPSGADAVMIRREIAKCDVVCANCHRARTTERGRARLQHDPLRVLGKRLERHPLLADMLAADRGARKRGELPPPHRERNPVNGRFKKKW